MKISQAGIDFIIKHEGFELEPYQDAAGLWTVGCGHLFTKGEPIEKITEEKAYELLKEDLKIVEDAINKYFKKFPLTQNQFDALCSLYFNIGIGRITSSSVFRLWQDGKIEDAAEAFLLWNKITKNGVKVVSEGLAKRRTNEMELFLA